MKRKGFVFPVLLSSLLIGGLVACNSNTGSITTNKTITKITVSGDYKEIYHYGEPFELPTVMAVYSDGSKVDVTSNVESQGFNSYKVGKQTVTLTYDTYSTTLEVEVVNEVESISVSGQQTTFEVGDEFTLGGGKVYATYEDNSKVDITSSSELDISGFSSSSTHTGTITLIYKDEFQTSYEYMVEEKDTRVITDLILSDIQTEYTQGDDFIRPTAKAVYDDSSEEDVSEKVKYEYDLSVVGKQTVTATYKTISKTFDITVKANDGSIDPGDDTISKKFKLTNDTSSEEISAVDGVYTITASETVDEEGEISVTAVGKLEEGQIVVNAPDMVVNLTLNGVSISNTSVCPIDIVTADKVEISAKNKSTNFVYDNRPLSVVDEQGENTGAAIFAEDGDLKFKGKGSLYCESTNNNGIHGKDDVEIKNLTLLVRAVNNGIKGNDSILIESKPTIDIICGSDGLKTSNTDISSKGNQRGNIEITGGKININSYDDGIDAAYSAIITNGVDEDDATIIYVPEIDIYTNIYSSYGSSSKASGWGGSTSNKASDSAKGIKGTYLVDISGGNIYTKCYDDGIHGNKTSGNTVITYENGGTATGDVKISGGTITCEVSDDGIHADGTLTISGGSINVTKSYEGLEGNIINITGGESYVIANDDGVNAQSSITVSGGLLDVTVPSSGDVDGIDSNGTYTQTGGIVVVRGPADGGSWSLDTDGDVNLNGGTIVVVGGIEVSGSGGWRSVSRPGPGGSGGHGGGGGMGSGSLNVGSNMTKSTPSTGKGKGSFKVTISSQVIVTYSNSYSYSSSVTIYSELGSATVTNT